MLVRCMGRNLACSGRSFNLNTNKTYKNSEKANSNL